MFKKKKYDENNMIQSWLTCKPHNNMNNNIEIAQQKRKGKKYKDQFSINQMFKDKIEIN